MLNCTNLGNVKYINSLMALSGLTELSQLLTGFDYKDVLKNQNYPLI